MDAGLHYFTFTHEGWETNLTDRLTETAKIADEGGFRLFTVMDHYYQMIPAGGPFEPMLEGYTTLGYLAGITEQLELGLLVTGVTYRHPGLLAKIATTIDVLSRGRAWLGIGAAWYDREHEGLGVPFPSTSERFERLEETLQIVNQMWSDDDGAYDGTHFHLKETINLPQPPRGRLPIMIGGGGERKTLRLVAQYADATHLFAREGVEGVKHKLDVLREHCDKLGRDYDAIEKTIGGGGGLDPVESPDEWLAEMEEYAKLGVTLVTTSPQKNGDPAAWAETFTTNVLPRLKQI
ncbi:LLM class F420-dependent oxidoreductase [Nocardioides sp. Kera G14]|uniref:LLM class F420-dependent oxidoreductase n=1 Tax=Nocardioides sp. Kera G14 TaxID=2884264 RepID=UPI001D107DBA|nr:LLM class F420-dependent oxidoreductase [Nocardioides sp. Kera G14]UDY25237.1 LLM class F420-dependent oxidoreductase [Nocardioides sp. Kera G14]